MNKQNNSNWVEENKILKQRAQDLTIDKNYSEAIKCYEKIAKNIKIEKKAEHDRMSKFILKFKLKGIKILIKDLNAVTNALNNISSNDKHYFFKDLQETYHFSEEFDIREDIYSEQDDLSQIRKEESISSVKKYCYACKRELSLDALKDANPSLDEARSRKLFENLFIEFYCCDCFAIKTPKTPNSIVRDLIRYLNLLEKDVKYPLKRIWNFKVSNYQEEELRIYLEEVSKIKRNQSNDLTQDKNLLSLVQELVPDFIFDGSSVVIKETVLYDKFADYEKAIIFVAKVSPFFGESMFTEFGRAIPKRFQTSDFSKTKKFFYRRSNRKGKYYLNDFGCAKFYQICLQIDNKIDAHLKISNTFNAVFKIP